MLCCRRSKLAAFPPRLSVSLFKRTPRSLVRREENWPVGKRLLRPSSSAFAAVPARINSTCRIECWQPTGTWHGWLLRAPSSNQRVLRPSHTGSQLCSSAVILVGASHFGVGPACRCLKGRSVPSGCPDHPSNSGSYGVASCGGAWRGRHGSDA